MVTLELSHFYDMYNFYKIRTLSYMITLELSHFYDIYNLYKIRTLFTVLLLIGLGSCQLMKPDFGFRTDDEIHYINHNAKTTWKAGRNIEISFGHYVKRLLGVKDLQKEEFLARQLPKKEFDVYDTDLPESFDPRTKWPACLSLNEIRDQGQCGSCWAFGSVEAMTDRFCIKSEGKANFHFSAENLMGCCASCGDGCNGGSPSKAWSYFKTTGIVSGGKYNSFKGCRPYEIPPTGQQNDEPISYLTPECNRTCESSYGKSYASDIHFGSSAYNVQGVENIMQELITNGPVTAGFEVYNDFRYYKSGVYKHVTGPFLGNHAIKIIGYGVEDGTKYWLVANSWNVSWGDKGFFKIVRGRNECGIESSIVAGEPKMN